MTGPIVSVSVSEDGSFKHTLSLQLHPALADPKLNPRPNWRAALARSLTEVLPGAYAETFRHDEPLHLARSKCDTYTLKEWLRLDADTLNTLLGNLPPSRVLATDYDIMGKPFLVYALLTSAPTSYDMYCLRAVQDVYHVDCLGDSAYGRRVVSLLTTRYRQQTIHGALEDALYNVRSVTTQ